jgi:tRNA threonylcarbamoyladenosine biosynthesis protein TsaE
MPILPAPNPRSAKAQARRRDARPPVELELISHSLDQTRRIGARLAALLQPGDLLLLEGEFGTGKTSLTQGLAHGLNVANPYVTSPTFTLINEYPGRLPLYHVDLYRLDDPGQLHELGIADYVYGDGVTVIEWPELAEPILPAEHLTVYLTHLTDTKRALRFHAEGPRYLELLQQFKDQAFAHQEPDSRSQKSESSDPP